MKQRQLRPLLGIAAAALPALIYYWSFDNPFVFDDRITVVLNSSLADPPDLRAALLHNLARPVVNLSYALDRALWGFSSFGYHLTNLIVHTVVVALFYGWCTRALTDAAPRAPSTGEPEAVEWPAFFAAAAFGLHPLTGAAAIYVSARSELLAAVGVLAALVCARRAIVGSGTVSAVLAVAFGALALGSSAAAAALPLLVLAYDAWVLRDPGWRRRLARAYLPALAAIALLMALRLPALLAAPRIPARGAIENLLMQAPIIWRYLWLVVSAQGQSLVHQVRWVTTPLDPAGLVALALLAVGAAAAIRARRSMPLLAFGVVWFLAALAPTSSVVPLRDAMVEHRMYLATAGLLLAAASLVRGTLSMRRVAGVAAAAVLTVLAFQTYQRNRAWSDPMALWEEAVRRSPEAWQAHLGYGTLLQEINRCDRARTEYETVLRLYPGQPAALTGIETCR